MRPVHDGPGRQGPEHIADGFPTEGFAGARDQGAKHHGRRTCVVERGVRRDDV
ncbi:MAG TPA: hypothetical protein VF956_13690 [Candidatus Dormibacteraeota bacterium]